MRFLVRRFLLLNLLERLDGTAKVPALFTQPSQLDEQCQVQPS